MTRLVLDYYRRWSLVLSLGVALQLIQGWWITTDPRTPIEFTSSPIPICMGMFMLLFDLAGGMVRVVGTLPLTLAKIGRVWWLANVLIPAIALVALLFLGAGAAAFCHPDQAFPLHRLWMASLFTMLWLGMVFALIIPATGRSSNRWRPVPTFLFAILTVFLIFWMIFGFVLSPGSANNPVKLAIFLVGGTWLTFVGWFRAERFDLAGVQFDCPNTARAASFRFTRLSTTTHQRPEGHGGILFLLRTTFVKGLLACLAGAIGILTFAWCASRFPGLFQTDLRERFKTTNPTVIVLLMFLLFQRRPSLMQLRFMRTLPISTAKLAAVLIAVVILPAIAVGMLVVGIAGLSVGAAAAWTILKSCIDILAPMALCVFFSVWRGGGKQAYAFSITVVMVWLLVVSAWRNITFPLAAGVAVAGVTLAWLLTYYALLRGSRAYRVQTDRVGSFSWNARR